MNDDTEIVRSEQGNRLSRWIPVASFAVAVSMAGVIVATHPMSGHGDPGDALRTSIRATGMLSALLFVGSLFARRDGLRRDLHRGVLTSHVVHGVALAASGLLVSAQRIGEVAAQSHVIFALFPDWTPMVLGSVGYLALALLAAGPRFGSPRLRLAAEAWLLTLFVSFYADAAVSHAHEGLTSWLLYGALLSLLIGGATVRGRRLRGRPWTLAPHSALGG